MRFADGREETLPDLTAVVKPSRLGDFATYTLLGAGGVFFGGETGLLTGGLRGKSNRELNEGMDGSSRWVRETELTRPLHSATADRTRPGKRTADTERVQEISGRCFAGTGSSDRGKHHERGQLGYLGERACARRLLVDIETPFPDRPSISQLLQMKLEQQVPDANAHESTTLLPPYRRPYYLDSRVVSFGRVDLE